MATKTKDTCWTKGLQEAVENRCKIIVFMVNGFQMKGTIDEFDESALVIKAGDKRSLVMRHAVSTVVLQQDAADEKGEAQ